MAAVDRITPGSGKDINTTCVDVGPMSWRYMQALICKLRVCSVSLIANISVILIVVWRLLVFDLCLVNVSG